MSPTDRTYTVAIAGMGKRGTHHADAFAKNPRFQLVGLCDPNQERVDAARQAIGAALGTFGDAARMLAETKPDIFAFCTLPSVRLDLIRAGVEAGVKLIAYEKPMATSTDEALEIMRLLHEAAFFSALVSGPARRALLPQGKPSCR